MEMSGQPHALTAPPPPPPQKRDRKSQRETIASTEQKAGWTIANGKNNLQNNEIKIKLYTKQKC
jgi:hypothetical protein